MSLLDEFLERCSLMILVIITDCIFYELIATNFAEGHESTALKITCSVETFFKEIFLVFIVSFQSLNMRLIKKTQVLDENWNTRIENVE